MLCTHLWLNDEPIRIENQDSGRQAISAVKMIST
jgi:hypothetical protein